MWSFFFFSSIGNSKCGAQHCVSNHIARYFQIYPQLFTPFIIAALIAQRLVHSLSKRKALSSNLSEGTLLLHFFSSFFLFFFFSSCRVFLFCMYIFVYFYFIDLQEQENLYCKLKCLHDSGVL